MRHDDALLQADVNVKKKDAVRGSLVMAFTGRSRTAQAAGFGPHLVEDRERHDAFGYAETDLGNPQT